MVVKNPGFLPLLRELACCYQAFESHSAAHIRTLDLTPAQFDLLATLGNTAGMSFKELGEKTLITKGTLTGVVDRMVAKRLVRRARQAAGKPAGALVTVQDFCRLTGLDPAEVSAALNK